ncbi:MAG: Uncharacterized protein family UPF0033 [Anaerolineales bacterium]|jgi:tRNA 2-thiouridine synthesizing protein A|nr:Uncharacterized protein family UPF0033 [Anaerolineales bacterium]
MTTLQASKVLDCSGMPDPFTTLELSKAIKGIEVGQILKMIATDMSAPSTMKAWSQMTGNELLEAGQEGGKFVFYFRRVK